MTELPNRLLRDALDEAVSKTPSPVCVDTETLAAWAEGTMSASQRAAVETHAAGCERCLAVLAAMARTEPPPVDQRWWRRASLAWLLPLATATAALVIVVRLSVMQQRSPAAVPAASTAADATPAPSVPTPPPLSGINAREKSAVPVPSPAPRAAAAAAPAPAGQRAQQPAMDAREPAARAAAREKAETTTAASSNEMRAGPASPQTQAAAKDVAVTKPEASPAPPSPAAVAAQTPPGQPAVTSPLRDDIASANRGQALAAQSTMKTAASPPVVIVSPDRDSQWRIVAGAVEHTTDGGQTWQLQSIGVATAMRAGVAPDARVCWLAGDGGVVLRSTNGASWIRVGFPEPLDLVAIRADDASRATVIAANGRRFTTSDGGVTWTRQ